ncbi:TIGR03936 family radical SAM-associated protein, partial [bacterium]|nr:TIGR03936 family radical SAM-associated protein [bacterium]
VASGLPVAFSQGFNPHPKLSFGPPLPVGTTGDAEFFDIELTRGATEDEVINGLAAFLPGGQHIMAATQSKGRVSISAESRASRYVIAMPRTLAGLADDDFDKRLEAVRRLKEVEVKRGKRAKTVSPAEQILELRRTDGDEPGLELVLKLGEEGAMRPLDILELLLNDRTEALLTHIHHLELLRNRRDGRPGLEPL